MRVIRTELYFDEFEPLELRLPSVGAPTNPGIAAAWFRGKTPDFEEFQRFNIIDKYRTVEPDEAIVYLAAFMSGRLQLASWEELPDLHYVSAALNAPIVIEQSPPTTIPLGTLLAKAPGIAIGTFIGMQAAGDATALMFVTVPGGILVVSSAIGISRALEQGLNRAVARLMKRL
jgi:hypothetical protein